MGDFNARLGTLVDQGAADTSSNSRGVHLARFMASHGHQLAQISGDRGGG